MTSAQRFKTVALTHDPPKLFSAILSCFFLDLDRKINKTTRRVNLHFAFAFMYNCYVFFERTFTLSEFRFWEGDCFGRVSIFIYLFLNPARALSTKRTQRSRAAGRKSLMIVGAI